jgi:hypothetical protein
MAQDRRKFIAKEIRKEDNKVCYEIWIDHALLRIVWISVKQKATHGTKLLEDWCLRHEESLKNAGIAGVDLSNEVFEMSVRAAASGSR